jgi:signal peptidase I
MGKSLQDYGREWLDTLVVAISVAMAFRAYFYEPFNIPTGSMQPTLYGNHVEECKEPGIFETTPLKWLNWAISGRDYKEFVAPFSGALWIRDRNDGRCDLSIVSPAGVEGGKVCLPTDAMPRLDLGPDVAGGAVVPVRRRDGVHVLCHAPTAEGGPPGREVRIPKGHVVFRGYDTTGDFIFVNRWKWNFRAPARGDVMVFSTTGIGASPTGRHVDAEGRRYELQQGTHYIKRMTALPGETVEIVKPDVYIDGRKIDPIKPMTGKRGEKTPEPCAPGDGRVAPGPVKMGADEYYACGDNSDSSFDSRYWGPVPERNLRGIGSIVFWPLANPRWGIIR